MDSHEAFYDGRGNMPLGGEEINSGYKARIFVTPIKSIARTAIEKESCEHLIRDTGSECSWSCSADSPLDRCTLTTCGGGQSITGTNELLHLLKLMSRVNVKQQLKRVRDDVSAILGPTELVFLFLQQCYVYVHCLHTHHCLQPAESSAHS